MLKVFEFLKVDEKFDNQDSLSEEFRFWKGKKKFFPKNSLLFVMSEGVRKHRFLFCVEIKRERIWAVNGFNEKGQQVLKISPLREAWIYEHIVFDREEGKEILEVIRGYCEGLVLKKEEKWILSELDRVILYVE